MIAEFFKFMALAVLCFTGIWFALAVLGQETWSKKVCPGYLGIFACIQVADADHCVTRRALPG